jgi:hypothetical protein
MFGRRFGKRAASTEDGYNAIQPGIFLPTFRRNELPKLKIESGHFSEISIYIEQKRRRSMSHNLIILKQQYVGEN